MNDKVFVDTNILVYAHDPAAGLKSVRARSVLEQLWNSKQGVLSTQVLQEFTVTIRKHTGAPASIAEARKYLESYLRWEIVVNSPSSVLRALELEERYQISFWDALILQAAEASGASILYSEDLSAGQAYDFVRVVNPLKD
jgi:predicted nucleic acid-binding protein